MSAPGEPPRLRIESPLGAPVVAAMSRDAVSEALLAVVRGISVVPVSVRRAVVEVELADWSVEVLAAAVSVDVDLAVVRGMSWLFGAEVEVRRESSVALVAADAVPPVEVEVATSDEAEGVVLPEL